MSPRGGAVPLAQPPPLTPMTRKRKLIGISLLTVLSLIIATGIWLWHAFVWVFFVKPGDGGRQWSLPITAVAGSAAGESGFRDGTGSGALMAKPIRLAALDANTVVFADINNHAIRTIRRDGTVTTLAGGPDRNGYQDGPAPVARFRSPHGVAVRADGVIAVAEVRNHTIRLLTPDASVPGGYVVGTLAGKAGDSGMADGPAADARFSSPHAIAWGRDGELYVADIGNARLRCVRHGRVTTLAGNGKRGADDGPVGTLSWPMDLALDGKGGLWIADCGTLMLRRWHPDTGLTTPFPGQRLAMPHGVAVDESRVFVAEMNGQRVLMFDPATGAVATLCGTTEKGLGEGRLHRPAAVLAQQDVLWIADLGNHRIVTVPLPATEAPNR